MITFGKTFPNYFPAISARVTREAAERSTPAPQPRKPISDPNIIYLWSEGIDHQNGTTLLKMKLGGKYHWVKFPRGSAEQLANAAGWRAKNRSRTFFNDGLGDGLNINRADVVAWFAKYNPDLVSHVEAS
jgi:hypothetical protein